MAKVDVSEQIDAAQAFVQGAVNEADSIRDVFDCVAHVIIVAANVAVSCDKRYTGTEKSHKEAFDEAKRLILSQAENMLKEKGLYQALHQDVQEIIRLQKMQPVAFKQ